MFISQMLSTPNEMIKPTMQINMIITTAIHPPAAIRATTPFTDAIMAFIDVIATLIVTFAVAITNFDVVRAVCIAIFDTLMVACAVFSVVFAAWWEVLMVTLAVLSALFIVLGALLIVLFTVFLKGLLAVLGDRFITLSTFCIFFILSNDLPTRFFI
jgi:hypothetical protein